MTGGRLDAMQRFAEACVAPGELEPWMRGLATAALPIVERDAMAGASFSIQSRSGVTARVTSVGAMAELEPSLIAHETLDAADRALAYAPFAVTLVSRQFGVRSMLQMPQWLDVVGRRYDDCIGAMSASTEPTTLLCSLVPTGRRVSSGGWAAMRSLRRRFAVVTPARVANLGPDEADAIVDARGALTRLAASEPSGELARRAARALERERTGRAAGGEADAIWRELLAGGWTVVEHVDVDGKRMLLLRRSGPGGLSALEREVAARAARGLPNKLIALELGLSAKGVTISLQRALDKLGFASRVELARYAVK